MDGRGMEAIANCRKITRKELVVWRRSSLPRCYAVAHGFPGPLALPLLSILLRKESLALNLTVRSDLTPLELLVRMSLSRALVCTVC